MSRMPASMSILIVDDDEVMRELLMALLEAEGHDVMSAETPQAAAGLLRQNADSLDTILTDLRMPGTEAVAMLKALRGSTTASMRLIGMSGSDAEPDELELLDGFLLKPFAMEEFVAVAERARAGASQSAPLLVQAESSGATVLDKQVFERLSKALPATALPEMYRLTLDDVSKRAAAMKQAANEGDAETCRSEAHAMKGGCGMVGAMELRAIAADIETGALVDTTKLEEIAAAAERLRRMLDTLPL